MPPLVPFDPSNFGAVVFFGPGIVVPTFYLSPAVLNRNQPGQPSIPNEDGFVFTGVQTDLAILGAGWFELKDPITGEQFYTRFGDFRLDDNGYLIGIRGYRVQGALPSSRRPPEDIQIDASYAPVTTDPTAVMVAFSIQRDGAVTVKMSDGTEFVRWQILLQNFGQPDELQRLGGHLYVGPPAAGPMETLSPPGENGLGKIESGFLDLTPGRPQITAFENATPNNPFPQGAKTRTGRATDIAISGPGAFLVRDQVTSELFATRAGMFLVDSNNYLITYDRRRLQGWAHWAGTQLIDICIDTDRPATSNPNATVNFFRIISNGEVVTRLSDGTEFAGNQVAVADFQLPERLSRRSFDQFAGVVAAQPERITNFTRLDPDASWLEQGELELVNVSPELLNLRKRLPYFTQGALERTDNPLDLAIDGEGFFLLQHPLTGKQFATRDGHFHFDADGFIVNDRGLRLQGLIDAAQQVHGDLRLVKENYSNPLLVAFAIARDGWTIARFSDGTETRLQQVLLLKFKEPFLLREAGHDLYLNLAAAQLHAFAAPGTFGLGAAESSALELPSEPEQLHLMSRNGFRFLINTDTATRLAIQASKDLKHWRTIAGFKQVGGEFEYCDPSAAVCDYRFYRVKAEYEFPQFNRPELQISNVLTNSGPEMRIYHRRHRR